MNLKTTFIISFLALALSISGFIISLSTLEENNVCKHECLNCTETKNNDDIVESETDDIVDSEPDDTIDDSENDDIDESDTSSVELTVEGIAKWMSLYDGEVAPYEVVTGATYGMYFADGAVEIYQFDKESAEYQLVELTGYVETYRLIQTTVDAYNNGFVLIILDATNVDRNHLIEIFNTVTNR